MTHKVLSVLKGCISHIQLKLSDFSKGDPEPGKIIIERFTERTAIPVAPINAYGRRVDYSYFRKHLRTMLRHKKDNSK